jgi:hypothetical protein
MTNSDMIILCIHLMIYPECIETCDISQLPAIRDIECVRLSLFNLFFILIAILFYDYCYFKEFSQFGQ